MNDIAGSVRGTTRRQLLRGAGLGAGVLAGMASGIGLASAEPAATASARRRETFDFDWMFVRGDVAGAQAPEFDDSSWRAVDLPHDWSAEGPLSQSEPSGGAGGYAPTGVGWYRKRFTLPPAAARRSIVMLDFDGVYQRSEVYLNGTLLGSRPYGYVPFAYDLTPHLNLVGENVVAVRVDNSHQPNSRWYSGSGIFRHTWLTTTADVHVGHWGTFVTSENVSAQAATVQVRTVVQNEGPARAPLTLVTSLIDHDGQPVASIETAHQLPGGADHQFVQQLSVTEPRLWSVADPYLYTVRSTVRRGADVVDEYDTPFGIRSAVFDPGQGFLLNGEQVKLNGVCLHHDAGAVGAAVPERVWERRLQILKRMGCNAIRTGHMPVAQEFLDLCDRLGFLVMNELLDEWKVPKPQVDPNGYTQFFDEWYERDVVNVVHRDRNHPSVVLWSAGNEIADQSEPDGHVTLAKLTEVFHREDPTRLVTAGCDRIAHHVEERRATPEFLAGLDVVGYNYADRWGERAHLFHSPDREAFPTRRMIGTESRSMASHHVDVENLWRFVSTHDYVAGDFMWTGVDYLGETSWPRRGFSGGVLDLCGFEKTGFYFYQSQWTQEPMIHVFPHWNQNVPAGQIVTLRAYTNCDSVELFLNGTSYGRQGYWHPTTGMVGEYGVYPPRRNAPRTTSDLHLTWQVPYQPGTLRAVGLRDGAVVSTVEVHTTGAPAAIQLEVDRSSIAADRRDVAHVIGRIVDAAGRLVPTASNRVSFTIEGPVDLLATENGNLSDLQDYRLPERAAHQGRLLAVIRSTDTPGAVTVRAAADGLTAATASFATEPV